MGLYDDIEIGDAISSGGWSSVAPSSSSSGRFSTTSSAAAADNNSRGTAASTDKMLAPAPVAETTVVKKAPFMTFKPRMNTAPAAVKKSTTATTVAAKSSINSAKINASSDVSVMTAVTSTTNTTATSSGGKADVQQSSQIKSINNPILLFEETASPLEVSSTFDEPDPYDPSRPNDYSKICQEREDRKRQAIMIEENTEYVMELERIRAKRQQERDKAVASGDLKTLQELAGGAGRGARSKSNLPAWMTAQMDVAATAAGGLGLGNTAATHFES